MFTYDIFWKTIKLEKHLINYNIDIRIEKKIRKTKELVTTKDI